MKQLPSGRLKTWGFERFRILNMRAKKYVDLVHEQTRSSVTDNANKRHEGAALWRITTSQPIAPPASTPHNSGAACLPPPSRLGLAKTLDDSSTLDFLSRVFIGAPRRVSQRWRHRL